MIFLIILKLSHFTLMSVIVKVTYIIMFTCMMLKITWSVSVKMIDCMRFCIERLVISRCTVLERWDTRQEKKKLSYVLSFFYGNVYVKMKKKKIRLSNFTDKEVPVPMWHYTSKKSASLQEEPLKFFLLIILSCKFKHFIKI